MLLLPFLLFAQSKPLPPCPNKACCESRLEKAWESFEVGHLERVRELLEEFHYCRGYDISKDKVNEGYEMLITSLIYMNLDTVSEARMEEFLRYNPIYVPDVTKADFYHLYEQYRTHPILVLGVGAGLGRSKAHVRENYSMASTENPDGKGYHAVVSNFRISLNVGIPLGKSPFELGVEPTFFTQSYRYRENLVSSLYPDDSPFSTLSFKEEQKRIGMAMLCRYYFPIKNKKELGFNKNTKKIQFYIYGGMEPSRLTDARMKNIVRRLTDDDGENEGAVQADWAALLPQTEEGEIGGVYPQHPMRVRGHNSILMGVGFTKNIGEYRLGVDFRAGWMLRNQVVRDNRYAYSELLYKFAHVDDDFAMSNMNLSVSFQKRIFHPVKKGDRDKGRQSIKDGMVRERQVQAKEVGKRAKMDELQKRREELEKRRKELEERRKALEEQLKEKKTKHKENEKDDE